MSDIVDFIQSLGVEPNILGRALIVCGTAFVCSGLVFLLPGRGSTGERAFKENTSEIDGHLDRMRRDQRYLPPR
jgi:hypothetical protein